MSLRRLNIKLVFTFFINRTISFLFNTGFALFSDPTYLLLLVRFTDRLLWKHDTARYRLWKGVQKCKEGIQTQCLSPSDWAGKSNSAVTLVCCKGGDKRGNIVADTLLLVTFPCARKLRNICCGHIVARDVSLRA